MCTITQREVWIWSIMCDAPMCIVALAGKKTEQQETGRKQMLWIYQAKRLIKNKRTISCVYKSEWCGHKKNCTYHSNSVLTHQLALIRLRYFFLYDNRAVNKWKKKEVDEKKNSIAVLKW